MLVHSWLGRQDRKPCPRGFTVTSDGSLQCSPKDLRIRAHGGSGHKHHDDHHDQHRARGGHKLRSLVHFACVCVCDARPYVHTTYVVVYVTCCVASPGVLSRPVLSRPVLCCPVLFCRVVSCLLVSSRVFSCRVVSCSVV